MKISTPFRHLVPTDLVENLRWRAKVHHLVIEHPEYAELFREACARDPIFFINGFLWTHDPRCEPFAKLPFILYEFQEEGVLELLKSANEYDVLIEKSRTMGVSWFTLATLVWIWQWHKGRDLLLGSRTGDLVEKSGDMKSLFPRLDFLIDNQPKWLLPEGFDWSKNRTKCHVENPDGGCAIDGEATTENFGTGDRNYVVFLDEFSKVPNGDQMLASTQAVTYSRWFNGTPFGINNAFYELTRQPRLKKLRFHWTLHPIYRRGLYKKSEDGKSFVQLDTEYWSQVDNPDEKMAEYDAMILEKGVPLPNDKERSPWYANECMRAKSAAHVAQELDINYLGSGGQFFDPMKVQDTIDKYARDPTLVGDLEYDHQTGDPIRFRPNPKGRLRVWFQLDNDGNPSLGNIRSALGCDVSAGTGASNSTACGWANRTNEKLLEYVNPFIRPEEFAKQAKAIGKWIGNARIIWEARGPGLEFGAKLMELNYGNIYLRKNDTSISGRVSDVPGWPPGKESKRLLLSNYRDTIETGECCNYSRDALEETLEYVFGQDGTPEHQRSSNKDDPSGAKDNHGDRVIGDALAWKLLTYTSRDPQAEKPEIKYGSLAWRNQQRMERNRKSTLELSNSWRK